MHTTLIISNNELHDIIKIVKSLKDSGLLLEGVTKTVQNEVQKGGFLSMLLGSLGVSLLGNLGGEVNRAEKGKSLNRAFEGIVIAGYGNKVDF